MFFETNFLAIYRSIALVPGPSRGTGKLRADPEACNTGIGLIYIIGTSFPIHTFTARASLLAQQNLVQPASAALEACYSIDYRPYCSHKQAMIYYLYLYHDLLRL